MPPRIPTRGYYEYRPLLDLYLCPACRQHAPLSRLRFKSTNISTSTAPPPSSAAPMDDYYALLLRQPLPFSARSSISPTARRSQDPKRTSPSDTLARARVVFGSRLAGPAARKKAKEEGGELIAGVRVPPRPSEPDNCCMSGCVNCVWDAYREDLEEWVGQREAARKAERAMILKARGGGNEAVSVNDDGGGLGVGEGVEDVLSGVPVGIREFMRTEKRLGEKKRGVEGAI